MAVHTIDVPVQVFETLHPSIDGVSNQIYSIGDEIRIESIDTVRPTKRRRKVFEVHEILPSPVPNTQRLRLGPTARQRRFATFFSRAPIVVLVVLALYVIFFLILKVAWYESRRLVANRELEQISKVAENPGKLWRVCIYDGAFPSYWTPDGLWSRAVVETLCPGSAPALANGASMRAFAVYTGRFTYRINAHSSYAAATLLRKLAAAAAVAGAKIDSVVIADHGTNGVQTLNELPVSDDLFTACEEVVGWDGATGLILVGCSAAGGESGKEYIRLLAKAYHYNVTASGNTVRANSAGEVLEYSNVWKAPKNGAPVEHISDGDGRKLFDATLSP